MFTSVEIIAVLIAAAGLLKRMDARFDAVDKRIHEVQSELNEVKVAVARLEGLRNGLIFPGS